MDIFKKELYNFILLNNDLYYKKYIKYKNKYIKETKLIYERDQYLSHEKKSSYVNDDLY